MSLLDDILAASGKRLAERKRQVPIDDLRRRAADAPRGRTGFREALESTSFSLVAEVKARSPSGGAMDPANVEAALAVYDAAPAVSAVSILTDEDHFGGSLERLRLARRGTQKPILRKDFIVDEYQVWEARAHGADAVLLMVDLYRDDAARLAGVFELVRGLGMDALFELGMHSLANPQAVVPPDAAVWGVNARRFESSKLQIRSRVGRLLGPRTVLGVRTELSIDADAHDELRSTIPDGKVAIAESGIHDRASLRQLFELRYRAALVGTAFLKKGADVQAVVGVFGEEVRELTLASGAARDLAMFG
jgi:indole-3-glycerol phosphate synthase